MTTVRIRRSPAVTMTLEGSDVVGFDSLSHARAVLPTLALELLGRLDGWKEPGELFSTEQRAETSATLLALLDLGFVLVEGTPAAEVAARLERHWEWGPLAAGYHFGIKYTEYVGAAETYAFLEQRAATTPLVPLHTPNTGLEVVALPPGRVDEAWLGLLHRRRSSRAFDPVSPLSLQALADCLFAGFGVVGFISTAAEGEGRLPLTMAPSGGARNPFEAYVVARNVAGLEPGVYHYSGVERTLGHLGERTATAADLLGGQPWLADAAATILVVANFERCSWKYQHPTAFRVTLIAAGHAAQNVLLAATAHDLAATPTCAVTDRLAEELLGLDSVKQAAVHGIALGPRAEQPSPADPLIVERVV